METRDILDLSFGVIGFFGVLLSIIFYYREKLSTTELEAVKRLSIAELDAARKLSAMELDAAKTLSARDLEAAKRNLEEFRELFHWQLQAVHHYCNRVENIMHDPERPDKGVCEVARCIRDIADAMMGQLLKDVYVFHLEIRQLKIPKLRRR